jgi:hypothetical protein
VALETTEEHVTLKIVAGLSAILPLEPSSHVVRRVVKALGLAASRLSDVNIVLRDFDELVRESHNASDFVVPETRLLTDVRVTRR